MAVPLRADFDAVGVRCWARKDGPQARRLLALAAIYEGASRTEAARIGGGDASDRSRLGAQVQRRWSGGSDRPEGSGTAAASQRRAPRFFFFFHFFLSFSPTSFPTLAAIIESGPIPAVHRIVRSRIVDLCQWIFEEFRVVISRQTLSRELRAMGYRKLSARPRHHAQAAGAIEDFKKSLPDRLDEITGENGVAPEAIEVWFADEARVGQKNKITRRWAKRGTRPSAPKISERSPPISSARSAPRTAKAQPSSCPDATPRR